MPINQRKQSEGSSQRKSVSDNTHYWERAPKFTAMAHGIFAKFKGCPKIFFPKTLQKQSVGKLENPEPPDFIHYQVDLSCDDYSKCYRKLKKAVMKSPRVLDIELTFCVITSPEFCLMVHELLTERKSPQTQVRVTSRCSLLDGSVLLLLAGEKRFVSPYTWMQLTSPRRVDEEPVENRRVQNHVFRTADGTYFRTNYASCLRLISRYLPLNRVAGRRLNMRQILGEYDLLAGRN